MSVVSVGIRNPWCPAGSRPTLTGPDLIQRGRPALSMIRNVFLPVSGPLEVLSGPEEAETALQGAVFEVAIRKGLKLSYTRSNDQVNARAASLAGFMVQGDALISIVLDDDDQLADYIEHRMFGRPEKAKESPEPSAPGAAEAEGHPDDAHELDVPVLQASHSSFWHELPCELIEQIMQKTLTPPGKGKFATGGDPVDQPRLKGDSSSLLSASAVCKEWRSHIAQCTEVLRSATFGINESRPFNNPRMLSVPSHMIRKMKCPPLPHIVVLAANAGNASASVSLAGILDLQGLGGNAMKYWRKAAKHNMRRAHLRVAEAFYKGSCNMPQDAEEAHLWLNRAVRDLPDKPTACSPVAAKAYLLLGFLYFDGEGVPNDQGEAVRYFRLAVQYGSKEAEKTLGSIYNTGQYGNVTQWG